MNEKLQNRLAKINVVKVIGNGLWIGAIILMSLSLYKLYQIKWELNKVRKEIKK